MFLNEFFMPSDIQLINGIGKQTAERMKQNGIDSIEKLASSNIEDLLKIKGIGDTTAKQFIFSAQNYLKNIKGKERGTDIIKGEIKRFSTNPKESMSVSKTSSLEDLVVPKPSKRGFDTAQEYSENRIVGRIEKKTVKKEKIQSPLNLEEFLGDPEAPTSEKILDNTTYLPEETSIEMPIKPFITLKKEKTVLTGAGKVKSKKKQKKKKDSVKKKKDIEKKDTGKKKEKSIKKKKSIEKKETEKIKKDSAKKKKDIEKKDTSKKKEKSIKKKKSIEKKEAEKIKKDSAKKKKDGSERKKKEPDKIKKNLPPMTKIESIQIRSKNQPQSVKTQQLTQLDQKLHYEESTKIKEEKAREDKPSIGTFFSPETMEKIRFFHAKIKHLEVAIQKNKDFLLHDLDSIIDYVEILNINYKNQSQIKIFNELDITPSFFDPLEKKEIKIHDLMFECARALWVAAQANSYLSKKFESEGLLKNAIVAMVECSKMYKTAAYFSAACNRQENKGTTLSAEHLELNSEESRILSQKLATIREEQKQNLSMASNLYAGLSALTKRLSFLKRYDKVKENQLKAQYNYDIGKACHLKAESLLKKPDDSVYKESIEELKKKANYYFNKAEKTWENMLKDIKELSNEESRNIKTKISSINEHIILNDVETISENEAMKLQDPEPLIIVPENIAPFLPRTTNFLTQNTQKDLNFHAYRRYKDLLSEISVEYNEMDELQNRKAGIGRTLKQLKVLYDNNDIDINEFTHLFEKYSTMLATIDHVMEKLKNPKAQNKNDKQQIRETKSQT